jgi:hypothetical protein
MRTVKGMALEAAARTASETRSLNIVLVVDKAKRDRYGRTTAEGYWRLGKPLYLNNSLTAKRHWKLVDSYSGRTAVKAPRAQTHLQPNVTTLRVLKW